MPDDFIIQLGDYYYNIPMKYFMASTMNGSYADCDMFI